MIRIINGKRYDTEKAKIIAEHSNGYSRGDFNYEIEKLYRTTKGAWFLYYAGGANSSYREWDVDAYINSSGIKPLTVTEAFEWCQLHNKVITIEKYFSEGVEDA